MNVYSHCSVSLVCHHNSIKDGKGGGKHNQEYESEFYKVIGSHGHTGHRILLPACGCEYNHCGIVYLVPLRHPCSIVEVCDHEQENGITMKEGDSFVLEEGINLNIDQGKLIAEFIDMITENEKDEVNSKVSLLEMFLEFASNNKRSIQLDEVKRLMLLDFLEKQDIDTQEPFYVNGKEFRFTEDDRLEKFNYNQHHHFMYGIHVKRMFDGYGVDYCSEN